MIPIRITLANYGPFRGEHVVDLKPLIYSVVARDVDDPERSNWIGKSWFMSAFRYALFGKHPGRTKDKMITDGESDSSIRLDLEGNVSIVRSKHRGDSEQLVLRREGSKDAKQDQAQALIDELVGFDRYDFDASCWVRQKGANEIVVADPAVRTNTVTGWMDLGKLQEASVAESNRLVRTLEHEHKLAARMEQLTALIGTMGDATTLAGRVSELEAGIGRDEARLVELYEQLKIVSAAEKLEQVESALERVVADGKALKESMIRDEAGGANLDANRLKVGALLSDATVHSRQLATEADRIRRLVVGAGFDGVCPVTKTACPSAAQIKAQARKMTGEYEDALKLAKDAEERRLYEASELARLNTLNDVRQANIGRLEALRMQAKTRLEEIDALKKIVGDSDFDGVELRAEAGRLQARIGIDKGELREIARQLSSIDGWLKEQDQIKAEMGELANRIRTHREAVVVLGRNGAQREIARKNLEDIESGANDLLGSAGIDLSVKASWGREGGGLASHCQSCGQPFPTSAREKTCATCGAARGPKIIEKLELELSRESDGAAEDIAGLAMQLSAAAWLRARRQAAWSAMFIDEPFAACDPRIGSQLAGQLRMMLGGRYSFRQAFIVAHTAAVTESMPGRIEIVRARNGELKIETRT